MRGLPSWDVPERIGSLELHELWFGFDDCRHGIDCCWAVQKYVLVVVRL